MLWGLEFYDHVGKGSSTTVFGLVDAEVTAHLLHDDEEVKGGIEVPNAIRDTFSRTYFENIVSSTKECIVNCAKDMNDESEKIVIDLLESVKDNNLGLRCVSFKFSTREGIVNAIRINFQREKQLRFEVLKGVKVEDEVEHEGEKGSIKQVLYQVELNQ